MFYSPTIINNEYAGYNPVNFGYEKCKPLHSYGPAVRDHWLLHYVVSGKGVFMRDGELHHISAGEIFVIEPFCETFYQADENDPWNYIWIGFTTKEKLPDLFNNPTIKVAGLDRVFEDMRLCKNMENGRSAYLSAKIWELMAVILESSNVEPDHIEKAIHCMNSQYMNNINVSKIAKQLNLDRCYFSTLFTKKMGISPTKYLINLRLEKAAELMKTYGESPSVAAFSVGYTDIYNFSKSFKQKYGISPRNYMKVK